MKNDKHKKGAESDVDARKLIQRMADQSGISYDEMLKKLEELGKTFRVLKSTGNS